MQLGTSATLLQPVFLGLPRTSPGPRVTQDAAFTSPSENSAITRRCFESGFERAGVSDSELEGLRA